jgi:hypothetical protein
MHSFKTTHYTFIVNSDLSGSVEIVRKASPPLKLVASDLLEFVAQYVARQRIAQIESQGVKEILGL